MFILLAFFALAALADYGSVWWKHYHDEGSALKVALGSMALEAIGWVAIWFAIVGEDWHIAAVSIIGSGLGGVIGMKHLKHTTT